jgi:hypothetical protein
MSFKDYLVLTTDFNGGVWTHSFPTARAMQLFDRIVKTGRRNSFKVAIVELREPTPSGWSTVKTHSFR